MKVTRSYWLGLGSGLILSAMLTLVISPLQRQAVIPQQPPSVSPVKQQATAQTLAGVREQTDSSATAQPTVSTPSSQAQSPNTQSPIPTEQSFIIPKGASSERIADLLMTQGFIKDKDSFLASAHQMGVERKFRTGTFTLAQGLSSEEVIKRLLK